MALGRAIPADGAASSMSPSSVCSSGATGWVACRKAVANGEACKGPWLASGSPLGCSSEPAWAGGADALRRVL
eukprot:2098913-Amphidinium_carterae.1